MTPEATSRMELERRLSAAVQRIADPCIVARVREPLLREGALAVFALLIDDDARISAAAHECAMLRFAWIAAVVAESFAFDALERDDLVQRTFLDLPRVVRRARSLGTPVTHPEGWLRRRAGLIARQMLREERGTQARGIRVPLDAIDHDGMHDDDALRRETRDTVHDALAHLAAERPLWAQVLSLYYLEGYALDEIALRIGRSHGTVRNDAQRARLRLLDILRERGA